MIIGSIVVSGYTNLDYSNPLDNWVDLVISLNQSGNNFTIDNINVKDNITASSIRIYNASDKYIEIGYDGDGYIDTNAGDLNIDSQTRHVGFGDQTNPEGVEFGLLFSNEDELNRDNVRIGWYGGTSRVVWEDAGYPMWEVDNSVGDLRFYQPGKVFARLSNTSFSLYQNIEFIGRQNWTDNQNYPAACPAGTFLTQLGDSVTCTVVTAEDVDPGTFPTGNYTFQDNITILGNLGVTGLIRGGFIDRYESGNFNGSLYTNNAESQRTSNDANSLFQVISDTRGTPQFLVQDGGPSQASFITRSFMVVNQNNTLLNDSQNNICSSWGFNQIDCNTSTTGADFGVTDDIEALGLIYSSGLRSYKRPEKQRALFVATENITTVFEGFNGNYDYINNIFCDFTSDNFYALDGWININDVDSFYEGTWANIGELVNSSCVELVNNPIWKTSFNSTTWRAINDPELIYLLGGFGEYYIGDSPRSGFEFNAGNGTGIYSVVIDDTAGTRTHKAFQIEQDMNGYSTIAQNIYMYSTKQLVNKDLTMLSMVGEATNMNNSNGVFIDMSIIGQPLNSSGYIDGIHMPAGMDHLIDVGSTDVISNAYYQGINITRNITTLGETVNIFVNDNDVLYVGNNLNFTNIGITLTTPSSRDIIPEYYYCNGSSQWQSLTGVSSTTGGFTSSGTIRFTNPTNRGTCNKQLNGTIFSNPANYTYIAIKRTKNNIVTTPVIDLISISGASTNMYLSDYILRLNPTTAPGICDVTNLGAIYFDSDWDDICVCKSTGEWTIIGSDNIC